MSLWSDKAATSYERFSSVSWNYYNFYLKKMSILLRFAYIAVIYPLLTNKPKI